MKKEANIDVVKNWRQPKFVLLAFFFIFAILLGQFAYLSLSPKVYGDDLKAFAEKRITVTKELIAKRGTIYDSEGNILAIDVSSYTLIAYLDPSRTSDIENPEHVVDKELTAKKLSEVLDAPYDYILQRLEREGVYQVEFGYYGSKLTELEKLAIEDLELPGLDFIESSKRFYPNGTFASYIIGYAKSDEEGNIFGELGVESNYNDILKGTNGSLLYQKDPAGYQIPDTYENRVEAIDGFDIYLTLDSSIQRFLETAVSDAVEGYDPEWMIITVMDADTGAILGSATYPSFDANNLPANMSYQNPLISYAYEPGSVMKTYTYMCAIETGLYDGEKTYMSGTYKVGPNRVSDWKPQGWGKISYNKGYMYSSNVGSINVAKEYLSPEKLRECLKSYGFGNKTGLELSGEVAGSLNFNGAIELDWLSVSYGQGLSTTAIQQLQALSIIANDGVMVKPYIIKKIVNPENGEETVTEVVKSEQIVSKETVAEVKNLMHGAINNKWTPANIYAVKGFDVIGKTGTAQIYENGHYLTGIDEYLISFAGMYPKDNPEIIIYAAMKKPSTYSAKALAPYIKDVMRNIAKYKNMFTEVQENTSVVKQVLSSYINYSVSDVSEALKKSGMEVIVIGNGDRVVNQYPNNGTTVVTGDKVFLVTNGDEIKVENVIGWSRNDFLKYVQLLNIPYDIDGYGYIKEQSIKAGTIIDKKTKLEVKLENRYNIDGTKIPEKNDKNDDK